MINKPFSLWCLVIGFTLILMFTTAFDTITAGAVETQPQLKTIIAVDNQSSLNVPVDWVPMTTLNKNAELQAGNQTSLTYAIVLTEDARDFESFEKWAGIVHSGVVENMKNPQVTGPFRITVNGRDAIQYKISGISEGLKIVFLQTCVAGTKNYYNVLLWTVQSRYDKNEPLFRTIIGTFREILKK